MISRNVTSSIWRLTILFTTWSSGAFAQDVDSPEAVDPSLDDVDTESDSLAEQTESDSLAEETQEDSFAEETQEDSFAEETQDDVPSEELEEPQTLSDPEALSPSSSTTVSTPDEAPPAQSTVPLSDDTSAQSSTPPPPPPKTKRERKGPPSPFDRGRIRVGLGLGWASSTNNDWLILGVGGGYYIVDGLELGAGATFWVIGEPFVATLTPQVTYVLHFVPKVKPYLGGFYRHYFVSQDFRDTDSVGARFGVNIMTGRMSYFGGGAVYEHFLDDDLFDDRDQFYPEITFALSF